VTPDPHGTWDAEAPTYDEAPDHGLLDDAVRRAWRDLLLGHLPPPPARVLDLGCGTGTLTDLLARGGFRVDGIDASAEMVRRASVKTRGLPGVTVGVGDAADPVAAAGSYDVVLCRHVLWALPDPPAVLRRWVRLLDPAGRLVLVEGSWSTGVGLRAEQTVELVRAAGLDPQLVRLDDPALWGRAITDDRHLVVGRG